MFLKILNDICNLFLIMIALSLFNASPCSSTSVDVKSFETMKNEFLKELTKFKLENYLRKVKMKNLGILDDSSLEQFYFIEPTEKQILIINSIKREDLYSDEFEKDIEKESSELNKESEKEKFKAKIFAYLYKNFPKEDAPSDSLVSKVAYKIIGANFDEEKQDNWKFFLVLLNSSHNESIENSKQKLIKVCIPANNFKINFAILLKFEQPCSDIINKIQDKKILYKDENSETISNHLHDLQGEILSNKIYRSKDHSDLSHSNSFLEKSAVSQQQDEKKYSIDYLAQKFSVEELNKIKFLIKFAKKNDVIDVISKTKGEMTLSDLITQNQFNIKKKNFESGGGLVNPFANINFNNSTMTGHIMQLMANEIYELKSIIMNQNMQFEIMFDEMKRNMNDLRGQSNTNKKEVFLNSGGGSRNIIENDNTITRSSSSKNENTQSVPNTNGVPENHNFNKDDVNKLNYIFGYHGASDNQNSNDKSAGVDVSQNKINTNQDKSGIKKDQDKNQINMNKNNAENSGEGGGKELNYNNSGNNNLRSNLGNINNNNNNFINPQMMNNQMPMNNMHINGMPMNMLGNIPINQMPMQMIGNMPINNVPMNNIPINMISSNIPMNNLPINMLGNIPMNRNINMGNMAMNNLGNTQINSSNMQMTNNLQNSNNFKFKESNSNHNTNNKDTNQIRRDRPPHNLTLMRRNGKPLSPFLTATNLKAFQDEDDLAVKNIKHSSSFKNKFVEP